MTDDFHCKDRPLTSIQFGGAVFGKATTYRKKVKGIISGESSDRWQVGYESRMTSPADDT